MTVRHRCSILFWGTIARIGHLMQPRDVRSLEKRCHNQARMIYSLYVALMEKQDAIRDLLSHRGCWTGDRAEIPEEISAQFDMTLPRAREIAAIANAVSNARTAEEELAA